MAVTQGEGCWGLSHGSVRSHENDLMWTGGDRVVHDWGSLPRRYHTYPGLEQWGETPKKQLRRLLRTKASMTESYDQRNTSVSSGVDRKQDQYVRWEQGLSNSSVNLVKIQRICFKSGFLGMTLRFWLILVGPSVKQTSTCQAPQHKSLCPPFLHLS